jgi:hypothetical protein
VYFINHPISLITKEGLPFLSKESCVDIFDNIVGLMNAINKVADECKPRVPEKASIISPVRKPRIRRIQPGISNGRSIMNKM